MFLIGYWLCDTWIFGLQAMEIEDDPEESPEDVASMYKCETFETSEAVLKGARHMVFYYFR